MYGLIGKMIAQPGRRDDLLVILEAQVGPMPGCLSYVIAKDPQDANALWITEVWEDTASHQASLSLPQVKAAIHQAMPLIASVDHRVETEPVKGIGL
ncbi:MAG TPA: antibiotic biosynthesis monooxygenase family protein [Caulobacteraceae bacterium]|nr:antibiotic biosynthesis monooxygenase family protein [Caulobacteraceae bacterium]